MTRYAPTPTVRYDECPLKFILEAEGWTPREPPRWALAPIMGSAFAAATAVIHRQFQSSPRAVVPEAAIQTAWVNAESVLSYELGRLEGAGVLLPDLTQIDAHKATLQRAVTRYAKETPVREWDAVTAVEHTLPEWGNLRLDLAGVYRGQPVVADLKYKRYLAPGLIHTTERDYEYSWQFLNICRAWQVTQGLTHPPVTALILVVAEPTWHCRQVEFDYAEETLRLWEASAQQKWADMDALLTGKRTPTMATTHGTKYGPCPYVDACFTFHLDDELMKTAYVQLKKGGDGG